MIARLTWHHSQSASKMSNLSSVGSLILALKVHPAVVELGVQFERDQRFPEKVATNLYKHSHTSVGLKATAKLCPPFNQSKASVDKATSSITSEFQYVT